MALVETLPLGNRCLVHLVRVGNRQVLVGLDAGGLKSLVALPDAFDDALARVEETPAAEAPPMAPALAALVGPTKPAAW
jgi:flagellar biogenesis protein FliO